MQLDFFKQEEKLFRYCIDRFRRRKKQKPRKIPKVLVSADDAINKILKNSAEDRW